MCKYANAVYGLSLWVWRQCIRVRVWLNSYMEKNARAFMRQMKKSMNETAIKDYNQLKVGVMGGNNHR